MRQILVYADLGVSKTSFEHVITSLQKETVGYCIRSCHAQELLTEDWEEKTDLLVMPGGRDLPYHQKLFPLGTHRISRYVLQGGNYLGLCAGAYFGAQEIIFEEGGALEVCGQRDLGFFPGRAIGPAFGRGCFRYDSDEGAEAAAIEWITEPRPTPCHAYFNGGCYFETLREPSGIHVLGQYAELSGQPAAIVECLFGQGKAVLSGVHLEISVQDWASSSAKMQQIRPLLLASEQARRHGFRSLLKRLSTNVVVFDPAKNS